MDQLSKTKTYRLFLTQFLLPSPIELVPYFFFSLLILIIGSRQTILVILADGSPVTPISVTEVFGQRLDYVSQVLSIPILGRIVLFLFWLGIGSVVYMMVWVFQNLAVEVYDGIASPKLKNKSESQDEEGWWGTTLSHTIFIGSSVLCFLFFIAITVNFLLPAWVQLFQIGLQTINEFSGLIKLVVSLVGTMVTVHFFILFWRLFYRTKNFIFNNYY